VEWRPWQTYLPDFQFSVTMFGPNLLVKDRELGQRYLTAYLKGARQYNQGKTARNVAIISQYTQIKPEEVQASCWMSIRADGLIDLNDPGLLAFQEWAVANGYQDAVIPPAKLIDLSQIQAAGQALQ